MADLITRLETTADPGRDLSSDFVRAIGGEAWTGHGRLWLAVRNIPGAEWSNGRHWAACPRYLDSLDAALSLAQGLGCDVGRVTLEALGARAAQAEKHPYALVRDLARHACVAILRSRQEARPHG